MRENDGLKDLLASKFDREIITQLLNIDRIDLDEILRNCNYSDTLLRNLMTYKLLEAISGCYEEYQSSTILKKLLNFVKGLFSSGMTNLINFKLTLKEEALSLYDY